MLVDAAPISSSPPGGYPWRYKHVHFLFETGDFDRPTIRVAVPSRSDGEAWNAKLSILMS